MSGSNFCFLTCIQVYYETDKVIWYSHFFKNLPQFVVIHIVKDFSMVNEAEVDVCLEFPCFFNDPVDVGNLISGSSAFLKSGLYIWKFLVHVLLKPNLKDFEYYLVNMEMSIRFFGHAFTWYWNENWLTFSSPVATAEFAKFAGILSGTLSQHHLFGFAIAQQEFHHLH